VTGKLLGGLLNFATSSLTLSNSATFTFQPYLKTFAASNINMGNNAIFMLNTSTAVTPYPGDSRCVSLVTGTLSVLQFDQLGYMNGTWSDTTGSTLRFATVNIQGVFQGGLMTFATSSLSIGASASFTLQAYNKQFSATNITVNTNAVLLFNSTVTMTPNTGDSRCNLLSIATGAVVQFDQQGYRNGSSWSDTTGSTLQCDTVTVSGRLQGGLMTFSTSSLTLNSNAVMNLQAYANTMAVTAMNLGTSHISHQHHGRGDPCCH